MLIFKAHAKVRIFQGYLSTFFYVLFVGLAAWTTTQFELWSVGFLIGVVAVLVGATQSVRSLREWRQEIEDLRAITYVLRKGELAVVNEHSGDELVYRSSEVNEVEAFKVPFGYQLKLYRAGEVKEHAFRLFGVRVFAGAHMGITEESGLLALRSKEEVDQILSCFGSA